MLSYPAFRLIRAQSWSTKTLLYSLARNECGGITRFVLVHFVVLSVSGIVAVDGQRFDVARADLHVDLNRIVVADDELLELAKARGKATRIGTANLPAPDLPRISPKPLRDINDICAIFDDRPEWRDAVTASAFRWGAPIEVQMAILWQESKFRSKARPPKRAGAGRTASGHISSAFGYPQALDGTWGWYRRETENHDAARDEFEDAADFVGWYMARSRTFNGIQMRDAFSHYLAYHEGHGGFRSRDWHGKKRLRQVASRVARQAARYRGQLRRCTSELAADIQG